MDNQEMPSRSSQRRGKKKPNRGGTIKRVLLWILGIIVLLIVAGACLFFYYASSAPKISRSSLASQTTTTIYDADNNVISRLGAQKREYASNGEIPTKLKNAVVAIEDRRFYKHHGVDPVRIIGAAVNDVLHRSGGMQGGSTLTQQLVKLSVFSTSDKDRTIKRKAQEAWLAINVENHFSKSEILGFYINKVYMGNGVYGMKTAAQYYYGKDLKDLTLAQTAMLAGIPQSPNYYNPTTGNTTYAKQRRNQVLDAMARSKYITQSQANTAKKDSVTDGLDPTHGDTSSSDSQVNEKVVDSYIKEVLAQLEAKGYNPYTDGLQVHTNLDLGAQKHLYNAANNTVAFQSDAMQTGVAVVDPNNGQIIAMLGGRKTGNVVYGLNRAVQTDRSSGSTVKPLMDYGPAIEYLQWPTYKSVDDSKFVYPGTNKVLHDFDNQYKGTMTMREALVQSRNVPAIKTLQQVGISRATEFLSKLGISQKQDYTLQNGIGIYVSPLQIAAAYAAFANGGTYYKPYYISSLTTQDGKTITYSPSGKRAMSKATAYMITDMLKGVFTDSQGSGTHAKISGVHQAGKTGSTDYPTSDHPDGEMDSWMAGYTKNYSIAIWTGYDHPMKAGHGITTAYQNTAQLLYKSLMSYLDNQNHAPDWTMPSSVSAVQKNGKRELVIKDSSWALGVTSESTSSSSASSASSMDSASSSSSSSSTDTANSSSSATNESSSSSSAAESSTTASSSSSAPAASSSSAAQSSSAASQPAESSTTVTLQPAG